MPCIVLRFNGPHEEWAQRLTPGGCKALCWLARNAVLASVPVPNADEASAETTPADTLADNPEKESRRSALHLAHLAPHSLCRDINCRVLLPVPVLPPVLRQGLRAHSVATLCVATECGAACSAGATTSRFGRPGCRRGHRGAFEAGCRRGRRPGCRPGRQPGRRCTFFQRPSTFYEFQHLSTYFKHFNYFRVFQRILQLLKDLKDVEIGQ